MIRNPLALPGPTLRWHKMNSSRRTFDWKLTSTTEHAAGSWRHRRPGARQELPYSGSPRSWVAVCTIALSGSRRPLALRLSEDGERVSLIMYGISSTEIEQVSYRFWTASGIQHDKILCRVAHEPLWVASWGLTSSIEGRVYVAARYFLRTVVLSKTRLSCITRA